MKKIVYTLMTAALSLFILAACGDGNGTSTGVVAADQGQGQEQIKVVATISIIADMVYQVAGDLVEIYTIVPIGDNPEEHDILPADMMAVAGADIIFFNGWNLEVGNEWFTNLMESTGMAENINYFRVTEGITPFFLLTEGMEDEEDPHAWLDLSKGIVYVENIARVLSGFSPENAAAFQENAENYIARLYALHNEWVGRFDHIPDSRRLLVSSEGAFRYFAAAYNLNEAYIWELNAEEEGTPEQMLALITVINNSEVRSLFAESSVDSQYIEQISAETGIPVFAMLFTDSLSQPGDVAGTYYDMMRFNLEMIYAGLTN
ncbi:MAG: zinc ABC transporter substrate-binding protein [Defluviitaleaceae bacterium]|nr:zinc ABC transporter substrate-binding protein [Defluviitaleaceae bacterium]